MSKSQRHSGVLNSKKIALFMPTLAGGGAERVMLTLAESFIRQRFDIDVVVSRTDGERGVLRTEVPAGAHLVDLAAPRLISSICGFAAYLRRAQPCSVVSAITDANCAAVCARALSGTHPRLVISQHSNMSLSAANATTMRRKHFPTFCRWTYPRADAVVAVSAGVADDLTNTIGIPRQRVKVIYNPVITSAMLSASLEPVNHPWFRPGEPPVLLGVGRLVPEKDFATLIRAFALLRKHRPARLVLLGEGEQRTMLTTMIKKLGVDEDSALLGFTHNPYTFMRAANVLVLSSRYEGLSNVIIEALACGTQVVSTDCPSGPAEILENGKWGQLVPVGDPERLASAISYALDLRDIYRPELDRSLQRFTARVIARDYLALLGAEQRTNTVAGNSDVC